MLLRARSDEIPRWREINHLGKEDVSFPVRYAAVSENDSGNVILLGRDLGMVAQLQNRLVQAQLTMEQDYERICQIERATAYFSRPRTKTPSSYHPKPAASSTRTQPPRASLPARSRISPTAPSPTDSTKKARRSLPPPWAKSARPAASGPSTCAHAATTCRSASMCYCSGRSTRRSLCRLSLRSAELISDAGLDRSLTALYRQGSDAIVFTD